MSGPRYTISPGDYVDEERAKGLHDKIMLYLGRMTDRQGWCYAEQIAIAKKYKKSPEAVCRAFRDLYNWGYLDKRTVVQNGKRKFWYRIKMDRDCSEDDLKKTFSDTQSQLDTQINLISRSSPTCSPDQVQLDPQIKFYNKDKRPPLTTPINDRVLTHTSGACVREKIPMTVLADGGSSPRVIEYFLRPLQALSIPREFDLLFFETLCDSLKDLPDGALQAGARDLIRTRSRFPSISICLETCVKHKAGSMLLIRPHTHPEAWHAWLAYYHLQPRMKWRVSRMESGEDREIGVPTLFPDGYQQEAAE